MAGATGYRIEHNGRAMCLITDTEHKLDKPDENILKLIEDRFGLKPLGQRDAAATSLSRTLGLTLTR